MFLSFGFAARGPHGRKMQHSGRLVEPVDQTSADLPLFRGPAEVSEASL